MNVRSPRLPCRPEAKGEKPMWRLALLLAALAPFTVASRAQALETPQKGRLITLATAVEMALGASHKRAQAEYDLTSQTARRRSALADMGPHVKVEASDIRFDKSVTASLGPQTMVLRPDQMFDGTLAVQQPITGLYTAWEHSRAERSQEKIAELAVNLSQSDAAFVGAEAYLRAQEAAEMIHIAEASLAATGSQVRDAQALLSNGRLIRSDLLRIKIAADEARASLARAIAEKEKAFDFLRYVLGLATGADIVIETLPGPASVIGRYEALTAATSPDAYEHRLELKQAALAVDRAASTKNVVHMKFVPQVNVFMKWDRIFSTPLPFGTPDYTRTYGVEASWDLWDNGSRIFAEQDVSAQVKRAEEALAETKDHLKLELAGHIADVKAAREALAARMSALAQAEEAYRLDKARFAIGLVTATDLVLSEASQTRARGAQLASLTEINLLMLKIKRATGATSP